MLFWLGRYVLSLFTSFFFLFFLQNLCVSSLYLIKAHMFTQDYIWMKSRSQKQRNTLYYENQLSFRDHAISHCVALPWCFMSLARRDLIPEAKSNLCFLKISARFTWLLLHLFFLPAGVHLQHGLLTSVPSCWGFAWPSGQGALGGCILYHG